jgi:arsenite transporter
LAVFSLNTGTAALKRRSTEAGLSPLDVGDTTCCYARSDRYWLTDPQGVDWEHFRDINWAVKPFSMALLGWVFVRRVFAPWLPADQLGSYVAGLILLAAAPCTAMVFVWSQLCKGDPLFTLSQVALNDTIMVVAFAPIVALLGPLSIAALLATLVLLFAFQGEAIIKQPLVIAMLAVPILIQVVFNSGFAYVLNRKLGVQHCVAGPSALIGASNFFELAVATAIALFGFQSGAALATVVGVLIEVPVMLAVVAIVNRSQGWYERDLIKTAS